RERKDRQQQDRALGAAPRQNEAREPVDHDRRKNEGDPRHDDAAEIHTSGGPSEQSADEPHQERVNGKVRDAASPAWYVGVDASRDPVVPAGIEPDDRITERAGR